MTRGTFANVRIKNLMVPGVEGGVTKHYPDGTVMPIYDASISYQQAGSAAGDFRGSGIRHGLQPRLGGEGHAVARREGRGGGEFRAYPPFQPGRHGCAAAAISRRRTTAQTLGLDGSETFDLLGLSDETYPGQMLTLMIHRADGRHEEISLRSRIDTAIEVDYYRHGGILPYVLRELVSRA